MKTLILCVCLLLTPNLGKDKIKGIHAGIFSVPAKQLGSVSEKTNMLFNMQHVPFAYEQDGKTILTVTFGTASSQWEIDVKWSEFISECKKTYYK